MRRPDRGRIRHCPMFVLGMVLEDGLAERCYLRHSRYVKRVVHKAQGFEEAHAWDVRQQRAMTPNERIRAAKILRDRVFPATAKDVRECHGKQ